MQIEIYHDTVCPWCRIGKRNLQIALEKFTEEPTIITYRTFFLNDAMPPQGADFDQVMRAKLGGQANISLEPMFEGPRRMGERVGLTFNFEKIRVAPNTTLSHRLIALTSDMQKEAMIDAIYKAYFEDGADIGQLTTLLDIAEVAGLSRIETEQALRSDAMEAAILAEVDQAHAMGITGVPFFVFNARYAASGAQPPEAMLNILRQVAARSKAEPSVTG